MLRCILALALVVACFPQYSYSAIAVKLAPVQAGPSVGGASAGALSARPGGGPLTGASASPLSLGTSLPAGLPGLSPVRTAAPAEAAAPSASMTSPAAAPSVTRTGVPVETRSAVPAADGVSKAVPAARSPKKSASPFLAPGASATAGKKTPSAVGISVERGAKASPKASSMGRLNAIFSAEDPAPLWDNSLGGPRAAAAAPGRRVKSRSSLLRPSAAQGAEDKGRMPLSALRNPVKVPAPTYTQRVRDWFTYAGIMISSLRWRLFTRTPHHWNEFQQSLHARPGVKPSIRNFRRFYLATLVMGSSGNFSVFGPRLAHHRIVIRDAWTIFNKYFHEDEEASKAFVRLLARAQAYNPARRATQFRKLVSYKLRVAAALPIEELPAFFDSLATETESGKLAEYQDGGQQKTLEDFDQAVRETILEMNKDDEPGSRVVGALLMGSFANEAAGPASDLDLQIVAENGDARHLPEFVRRLKARWAEMGYTNPIGDYQYALPVSKYLLNRIHYESYLIYTPYEHVKQALVRTEQEEARIKARKVSESRTIVRGVLLFLYWSLMMGALLTYEFTSWLASRAKAPFQGNDH